MGYLQYCLDNDISIQYIQPGKPVQNGFIERFNGSYRKELLDLWVFKDLYEVEELTEKYRREYNDIRPHNALNNQPTSKYKLNTIL